MQTLPLEFILRYILFPFIALATGIAAYFMNKRLKVFSNKKIIITLLLSMLILGLPGLLGWADYSFMPYIYISLAIFYLVLGIYNMLLFNSLFREIKNKKYGYECMFFIVQLILGAGLFSLLFNLCNELKYGLWACSCLLPYLFVSIYIQTYRSFNNIPLEIYKVWQYSPDKQIEVFNLQECKDVLKIELAKKLEDPVTHRIIAKSKDDLVFGEWFQNIVEDYNAKEPGYTIDYYGTVEEFGWIFYVKPSFFLPRRYIDPDLTIRQNKLNRPHVIMAHRVKKDS